MTERIAQCDFYVLVVVVVVFGEEICCSRVEMCCLLLEIRYHFRIIYIHFIIKWHFFSLLCMLFSWARFISWFVRWMEVFFPPIVWVCLRKTNVQCNSNSTGIASIKIERKFIEPETTEKKLKWAFRSTFAFRSDKRA